MYFTSYRGDSSIGEADIYVVRRSGDNWSQIGNAGSSFNTDENDGSLSIAGDGKTVVFASEGRKDRFGDTDLCIGELVGGMITNVKNLGANVNSKYWDSQPTISGDGKTIYFSSNRSNGFGGTDIWMTQLNAAGVWSPAQNLGKVINTEGDEFSPYITPDGGTLFFSSDEHPGYGKQDVFTSTMEKGAWNQPTNLGSVINSAEDEVFFYAPAKDQQFYFASSRPGGQGELDIYAGMPNVFGGGMFRLIVSVLDSVSGKPLPSIVNIVDVAAGNTLVSIPTDAQTAEYSQLLPAGRTYRVEAKVRDYPVRSTEVRETIANTERKAKLLFGAMTIAEFDMGKYDVPFFVTGYYRVNTTENLDGLYPLLDGPLKNATYIERFGKGSQRYEQYKAWAQTVEGIFHDVYARAVDEIFPRFKTQGLPSEILEIAVMGYADPQAISGRAKYLESETVRFEDLSGQQHTISNGDAMDNLKLSGLRAWHSGVYLDKLFAQAAAKSDYLDLKNAGKIRYKYIGAGVSDDKSEFAAQRRIRIIITRTSAGK
jgi:hypothetical protein